MLKDDVASNRAIGSYGANFIRQHTEKPKLSVLTHCNTGRCLLQYFPLLVIRFVRSQNSVHLLDEHNEVIQLMLTMFISQSRHCRIWYCSGCNPCTS